MGSNNMLTVEDRQHLFMDIMLKVKNEETYKKMRMMDKLEFLKSTSKIFQFIPEKDIKLITGKFLISNLSPRGRRRCIKLINFGKDLEKKVEMSDPEWAENFKNKIRGIDL